MKRHTGSGVLATTALAKVMSEDIHRGLELRIGPPAYDPHNNVLYLPALPGDDVPEEALVILRAYLAHEAGERGFSSWDPMDPRWVDPATGQVTKPGLRNLVNAINDARIDTIEVAKRFPGAAMNIRHAVKKDWEELRDHNRTNPLEPSVNLLATLCRYLGEDLVTYEEIYQEFPQMQEHFDKVEDLLRNLDVSDEQGIIEQAIKIYERVKSPEAPPPPPMPGMGISAPQMMMAQSGAGDPQSGDGDGSPGNGEGANGEGSEGDEQQEGSQGSGDAEGEGEGNENGDGSSEGENEGEGEPGEGSGDSSDESGEEEGDSADGSGNASGMPSADGSDQSNGNLNGEDVPGGDGDPHKFRDPSTEPGNVLEDEASTDHDTQQAMLERMVQEMFKGQDFNDTSSGYYYYGDGGAQTYTYDPSQDTIEKANPYGRRPIPRDQYKRNAQVLATRLRQVMTVPAPRIRRNRDRGEVDERAIHRLCMGDVDVMKRRIKTDVEDVAATVSWDESSSMLGSRITMVKELAYVWNEALGTLNIPTEMLGWTTNGRYCTNKVVYRREGMRHRIYKEFDDKWNDPSVLGRLASISTYGYTPMAEGLLFAAERLSRRRERRKLLFFLTDGQPGMEVFGDPQIHIDFIGTVLNRCRQSGIEVVGIGIGVDLSHIFEDRYVQVNNVNEIRQRVSKELIKILKEGRDRIKSR